MELTFGEITFLIEYLQSTVATIVDQMGASIEERKKIYEASMNLKGLQLPETSDFSDEAIASDMADSYNKLNILIDKFKNIKENNIDGLLNILFPFKDTRPTDFEHHSTQELIEEKKKIIFDFLNSSRDKISTSCFLGDIMLVGIKYLKSEQPKISIYECKDYIRHDFLLTEK